MATVAVRGLPASLLFFLLHVLSGCGAQSSQVQLSKDEFLIALPIHATKPLHHGDGEGLEYLPFPTRHPGGRGQIARPQVKNGPTYPIKREMNVFVKPLGPMGASKFAPWNFANPTSERKGRNGQRDVPFPRRNRYQPDGFFPPQFQPRQTSTFRVEDGPLRRRSSRPPKDTSFKMSVEPRFPLNFIGNSNRKLGPQKSRNPFRRRSLDGQRNDPSWKKMGPFSSTEARSRDSSGEFPAPFPPSIIPFISSLEDTLERVARGNQEQSKQTTEGPSSSLYAFAPFPPYPIYDFSSVIYQAYPPPPPFYPPYIYPPYYYPSPFYPVFPPLPPPYPWPVDFAPLPPPTFHVIVHPDPVKGVPSHRPDPIKISDSSVDEVVMIEVPSSSVQDAEESRGFFHPTF